MPFDLATARALLGNAVESGLPFAHWKAEAIATLKAAPEHQHLEPWAESDPNLPRLEAAGIAGMLTLWRRLRDDTLAALNLPDGKALASWIARKGGIGTVFTFDPSTVVEILALGDQFLHDSTTLEGPLLRAVWQAWVRGWINASTEMSVDAAITAAHEGTRAQLQQRGLSLVRSGLGRTLRDKVLAELSSGIYDGMNPLVVAQQLRRKFGQQEYNWERLVRSEMAIAQSEAKLARYIDEGIEQMDYVTAGDSRVCPQCLGLEAASPYLAADCPIPVIDTHPNCRCTIRARL
jgi:SPP1 gp7 family putative phage head morphogenesis protein